MLENFGRLKSYILAVLVCAIALPIAWELDAPSSCFLLAAMVSSLYGGRGPGYLTVVVSSILFEVLFLLPRFQLFHSHESYLRFAVFIAAMILATELIAAKRRSEESLRQTQTKLSQAMQVATLSEFSASVVHEISQPLSAMIANGLTCVRWLSTNPPNIESAQAAAERVVRDGKDAGEVIQGLRALFRRSPPEKILVDLRPIVNEVVSLIRGRAESEKIAVEIQLPRDLPRILGDRLQLQQVLMNLVLNAVDSMRTVADRPKTLVISIREQDGMVITEVRDQGIGISDFEKVFDAFFTTKKDGMGMGLSICRSIIEAHEGRLWGSPGPVAGTVFSFAIPRATEGMR